MTSVGVYWQVVVNNALGSARRSTRDPCFSEAVPDGAYRDAVFCCQTLERGPGGRLSAAVSTRLLRSGPDSASALIRHPHRVRAAGVM